MIEHNMFFLKFILRMNAMQIKVVPVLPLWGGGEGGGGRVFYLLITNIGKNCKHGKCTMNYEIVGEKIRINM